MFLPYRISVQRILIALISAECSVYSSVCVFMCVCAHWDTWRFVCCNIWVSDYRPAAWVNTIILTLLGGARSDYGPHWETFQLCSNVRYDLHFHSARPLHTGRPLWYSSTVVQWCSVKCDVELVEQVFAPDLAAAVLRNIECWRLSVCINSMLYFPSHFIPIRRQSEKDCDEDDKDDVHDIMPPPNYIQISKGKIQLVHQPRSLEDEEHRLSGNRSPAALTLERGDKVSLLFYFIFPRCWSLYKSGKWLMWKGLGWCSAFPINYNHIQISHTQKNILLSSF